MRTPPSSPPGRSRRSPRAPPSTPRRSRARSGPPASPPACFPAARSASSPPTPPATPVRASGSPKLPEPDRLEQAELLSRSLDQGLRRRLGFRDGGRLEAATHELRQARKVRLEHLEHR